MLSDRLITLARDADRAGLRAAAVRLIGLAHEVLDRPATGSAWKRSGKGRVHAPKPGGAVGGFGIARSFTAATAP